MIVELTWFELWQAVGVGGMRNIQARRLGRPDTHGKDVAWVEGGWGPHIEGAAAEMALAKFTNSYYEGVWTEIDRQRPDVGDLHVRSTNRENGCLILHEADVSGRYVLMVGMAPKFRIAGWINAGEGKVEQYWRTDTGRPAYFVPQGALHDAAYLAQECSS